MGNNKLINLKNSLKNLGGKIYKAVPAFAVLAVLGCTSTKDLPINNTLLNQKAKPQVTTLNNEDASYKEAVENYTTNIETKLLQAAINNQIYDETKYNYDHEKDVYTKYSYLAIEKAEANNQLANAYSALRDQNIKNAKERFNMTTDDIINIAQDQDNWPNIPDDKMSNITAIALDNVLALNQKNLTMATLGANKAEYENIDEFDGYNEVIYVKQNEKIEFMKQPGYNPRKFMKDVLNFNKSVILEAYKYFMALKGKDSAADIEKLTDYFNNIESLTKVNKLTPEQQQELLSTIENSAQIMTQASDMFVNVNLCRGLVTNMASSYRIIDVLDYMAEMGYDVENINIGTYAQNTINNTQEKDSIKDENTDLKVKPFFYGGVGGDFTGQHGGFNVAVGGNLPLNKTWALDGQIKGNFKFGWEDDTHDLATFSLEPGFEVTFGNHNLGANAIFGMTFMWDPSFTIGGKLKYAYKFNDYITAGVATELTYNFAQEALTLIGGVSAKFSFGDSPFKLITNLNGGWTFVNESTREIRPGAETPEQLPDEPIYGTDDTTPAGPTVHKGKPPVKSVDLTKY